MLATEYEKDNFCRILSLDGGGAKGFYTLGVLREIEGMLKCPLWKRFDLIFGTSTGSIIAALLALGYEVDRIHDLYKQYVPQIMKAMTPGGKTRELERLTTSVFREATFHNVKTGLGIVGTNWGTEKPIIFKASVNQAHGRKGTFEPGFGVTIAQAVCGSCSAYPFFKRTRMQLHNGNEVEVVDGGYCANNPTLYAIADAVKALNLLPSDLRVVSIGVGVYPQPKPKGVRRVFRYIPSVKLLQKTLEINTQSMEQLRAILFKDIPTVRISDTFERPEMATDFMEHNLKKLNLLHQRGSESFADREQQLREFLVSERKVTE